MFKKFCKKGNILLVFLCIAALGLLSGCEKGTAAKEETSDKIVGTEAEKEKEASVDVFAMDTYMEVTAYGEYSQEAVDAAAKEIERLDDLLSTGNAKSEVSRINENGAGVLSKDASVLLKRSLEIYKSTEGAYDITIYPLMQLWGFTTKQFAVPDEDTLKDVLELVGSEALSLREEEAEQKLILEKKERQLISEELQKDIPLTRSWKFIKNMGYQADLSAWVAMYLCSG